MRRRYAFLAVVGAIALAVVPAASAGAAPALDPSLGGWVEAGHTESFSVAYSGATGGDAIVTIELADGTMSVDDSGLSLVLQPGYTSFTGVTEIAFTGSLADVNAALADRMTWTAPSTPAESYLRLSMSVGSYIDGLILDPASGHYYVLSADPLAWADARDAAAAQNYNGLTGYLATVTSGAENTFLIDKTNGAPAYIAATSEIQYVNPLLDPADQYSDESELRGIYYWGAGPEAGQQVTSIPWFPGEPNGVIADRCLLTNWHQPTGLWNDGSCAVAYPYLVEFGGIGVEAGPATFDNLAAAPPARPAPAPAPELAATGADLSLMVAAGSLALVIGLGMFLVSPLREDLKPQA